MTDPTQETTPQNDLLCASIILQGLLASGHYTLESDPDHECDIPEIKTYDHGEEYKDHNSPRRYESWAILDTLELLEELKEQMGCKETGQCQGESGIS